MNLSKWSLMLFFYSSLALGADNTILGGQRETAHSYNPGGFCSSGAQEHMKKLNESNVGKSEKIKSYKDQIKNLAIYENILSETTAIKDRYEDSLQRIANGKSAKTPAEVAQSLGHVKSVLKSGMTLSALSLLIKKQENKMSPSQILTMKNLCQGYDEESICSDQNDNDREQLDLTLRGFQDLAHELPERDQVSLQGEVKKIISDIPKEIAPNAILGTLAKNSPTLSTLVKNADSQQVITTCLSPEADQKSLEACGKLMGSSKTNQARKTMIEAIGNESKALTGDLQRYNKVIATAIESSQSELEKALDDYDSSKDQKVQTKSIFTSASKTLAKAGKAIEDMDTEKKVSDHSGIEKFFKNKQEAELFTSTCDFSTPQTNDEAKMKQCRAMMEKVLPAIESAKTKQAQKIQELSQEIKNLADTDFKDTENLKEYVVERYLCACEKSDKVKVSEESLQMGTCAPPLMTFNKLNGLSNATSEIANTLYYNEIKMPMDKRGGKCDVDQKDLATFNDSCRNPNINKQFKDICASVTAEVKIKVDKINAVNKREREMEKLVAENHVIYDRSSPTGYRVAKKKSALRIFAEGAAPIVPMMVPTLLGNLQTRANIDMLTNQGYYQKQMLHNIDIYNDNPWMYNYNYFMSPYSYGITPGTTGTTGTTLGTSGSIGTGFSF